MTNVDRVFEGLDDDPAPPSYTAPLTTTPKPKNIILFGETGSGKSSVVNLIAGAVVVATSGDADACTLQSAQYELTLPGERLSDPGTPLRVFDTIGLEEPERDHTPLLGAIENAHALITELRAAGGVDLLLFCIRAGRITRSIQRHYRLFFEIMCEERVPLAIVVTHLEGEKVMDAWWTRNKAAFEKYGIHSVAHACITAAPAHLKPFALQRAVSRITVQRMLREALRDTHQAYVQDGWCWFRRLLKAILEYLREWFGAPIGKEVELTRVLEMRCSLPREIAQRIAKMVLRGRNARKEHREQ